MQTKWRLFFFFFLKTMTFEDFSVGLYMWTAEVWGFRCIFLGFWKLFFFFSAVVIFLMASVYWQRWSKCRLKGKILWLVKANRLTNGRKTKRVLLITVFVNFLYDFCSSGSKRNVFYHRHLFPHSHLGIFLEVLLLNFLFLFSHTLEWVIFFSFFTFYF